MITDQFYCSAWSDNIIARLVQKNQILKHLKQNIAKENIRHDVVEEFGGICCASCNASNPSPSIKVDPTCCHHSC